MTRLERAAFIVGSFLLASTVITVVNYTPKARAQELMPLPSGGGGIFVTPDQGMIKLPSLEQLTTGGKIKIPTLTEPPSPPAFPLEPYGGDAPASHINGMIDANPMAAPTTTPPIQPVVTQQVQQAPTKRTDSPLSTITTNSPAKLADSPLLGMLTNSPKTTTEPEPEEPKAKVAPKPVVPTAPVKPEPKPIVVPAPVKSVKETINSTIPSPNPVPATVAPNPTPKPDDNDNKKPTSSKPTDEPVPSPKPTTPTGGSGINIAEILGLSGLVSAAWEILVIILGAVAAIIIAALRHKIKRKLPALPFKGELK